MTLNLQRGSPGGPCQRRASTPLPASHQERLNPGNRRAELCHPQLGQSLSCEPRARLPESCGGWRSESSGSEESCGSLYRVVLLGDPGVGKSSLMSLFAGVQEKDSLEQQRDDTFERTLSVDGEETTLVVIDTWEAEKRPSEDENWLPNHSMQVGDAYVIVYSITDRGSFESASELRIQLRRSRQAENLPIILVGNKSDLVRSREISVEAWHFFPCRRPGLRRGFRLQIHRDIRCSPAQCERAFRRGRAADSATSGQQGGQRTAQVALQAQGELDQEGAAFPGPAGGPQQPESCPEGPIQVMPRPFCAVRDNWRSSFAHPPFTTEGLASVFLLVPSMALQMPITVRGI